MLHVLHVFFVSESIISATFCFVFAGWSLVENFEIKGMRFFVGWSLVEEILK